MATLVIAAAMSTSATAQQYVVISKGGGVTGHTTKFRISSAGEVAKATGAIDPEFTEFAHLRKGKTKKYFRKTRALLKDETFNYPGNTYAAIALVDGEKEDKMVWGDTTHEAPGKARKLYEKIQASINRLTFTKDLRN